ncbi:hypothetical protein [Microvirga guangxiensis]|uniref:Uncharacterized protein n=1 Tax=Microvirga guangxiensis TaxID=549386 RepID=A0A1G5GP93_9HYPH|nr:hypothetical protein [Microvirga guangxiensis]SCY53304.1 hypothetical protein SAMN02927923_01588 [Microvirga guangxiensis]
MNKRDHLKLSHPTTEFLAIALISLSLMGPALAQSPPTDLPDASAIDAAPITKGGGSDLSDMLPFLITSPDRERLAADLLSALEQGDLKQAESNLNSAIEAGTLAIALIDRIRDPELRPTLKSLGLRVSEQPRASASACDMPVQPIAANLAAMQEALDREQSHNTTISRELADLTGQHKVLTERLKAESSNSILKISELQRVLQQEKQQREAIAQNFASLEADYRALKDTGEMNSAKTARDIAQLETLLQNERERSAGIERELTRAREDVRSLKALKAQETQSAAYIAELEDALAQAQTRGDDFAQKLADAKQSLHSLQQTQERNALPAMPAPTPVKAEGFPALSSTDASVGSIKVEPAAETVAPVPPEKEPAQVLIVQLSETARPLSAARIAPVDPPAAMKPVPMPELKADTPAQETRTDDRLTVRADELFRSGDVSGARLLLERSLKDGNARAAFLLAETFDPHVLTKLGVRGIRGDAAKAREYYGQAQSLGMTQASERMEALK